MKHELDTIDPSVPSTSSKPSGAIDRMPASSGISRWGLWYRRGESMILGTLCIVLVLALWQILSVTKVINPLFASSPSAVATRLVDYMTTSQFLDDARVTGYAFIVGLALSLVVGIVFGLIMGWSKRTGYFFDYLVSIVYAAPRIAIVPLLVLWFGVGRTTAIAVVFLLAVFPVLINTMVGVRTVDPTLIELARSLKATRLQLFRTVIIPGSFPQIISGIRLAIGTGLIGVIVAEFLAGTGGIGYTMQVAAQRFDTAQLFAGLTIISVFGLLATELVKAIEHRFDRWRTT